MMGEIAFDIRRLIQEFEVITQKMPEDAMVEFLTEGIYEVCHRDGF
jgi:hypothetical protein